MFLFALVLIGLRYGWLTHFGNSHQIEVENGEVFITDDKKLNDQSQLVGEWSFYPNELLEAVPENEKLHETFLQVPGGWSSAFEDESPFGYGTYHLRIHIESKKDRAYALRMYSVRSASKVIVNGDDAGGSGVVSDKESTYEAYNKPYNTTTIRPDENGVIDVFVQVSNFSDFREGGIIRSVYFGSEEKIKSSAYLSSMLQVFSGTIFILHALFALIIYVIGIRKKQVLYYSLALWMLAFFCLNAGEEKIIMQLFPFNYVFIYKLSVINLLLLVYSILQASKERLEKLHAKIVPISSTFIIGLIIYVSVVPMKYLMWADLISMLTILVAMGLLAISSVYVWMSFDEHPGLILATIALINHFFWFAYVLQKGMKVMYYPFDLIIAVICLSAVWFKHYNDLNIKTKLQADRLAAADKEKDLFLANTAHELKNPLHGILNMSNTVLKREQEHLTEESERELKAVLSVSKRMTILVNDLLEMSRLEQQKPALNIQKTSLQGVVEGTIYIKNYLLERRNITITNKIEADFPQVLADENRLTQIMYNLLHNAIEFTEEGIITIDAFVAEGKAFISVSDTGVGIEADVLAELFQPYNQGDAARRENKVGGLGLGLYITKQLVEYMSGEIDVQSTVGEGTTFTFTLPVVVESVCEQNTSLVTHDLRSSLEVWLTNQDKLLEQDDLSKENMDELYKVDEDRPHIIVVDDDPMNLYVMEVVLSHEKYNVTTVLSGAEAIKLLGKSEYDLIISDVMMPQMSGFELVKKIRSRYSMSELPILLLTSRDRIRDVKYGFDVGANDYITKPLDEVELISRVRALTDVRSAAKESLNLEMAFLQAQIQPHFVFNTINSIMALSEIDIQRMQELLEAFSNVLRSKFQFKDMKQFVDLKQELQLIESYLYIEQVRFGDRVKVVWEIDDYKNIQIPSLTIQPLLENAIIHGIMTRESGGTITIKVIDHEDEVEIIVADDGVGIPTEKLQGIKNMEKISESGVGIYNTNIRLFRTYGRGLQIESEEGKGTKISFKISKDEPYRT